MHAMLILTSRQHFGIISTWAPKKLEYFNRSGFSRALKLKFCNLLQVGEDNKAYQPANIFTHCSLA
jgi:hypothetical protein